MGVTSDGATSVAKPPARRSRPWLRLLVLALVASAFIGLLLAGIVFLNVSLLELNGEIARTGEAAAELRRANSELRLEVAELGSAERIQALAHERGFVMPAPGEVTYLEADREADAARAAATLEALERSGGG